MIGLKLESARKALGHSQEAAAQSIGCSSRTLRNWERGVHEPTGLSRRAVKEYIDRAEAAVIRELKADASERRKR